MDPVEKIRKKIQEHNASQSGWSLSIENPEDPISHAVLMDCPSNDGVSEGGQGIGVVVETADEIVCRRICLCDRCYETFSGELESGIPPSGELVWGG